MQLTNIEELSAQVEDALRDAVAGRDLPLYDMMAYHLGWTGDPGEPGPVRPRLRALGALCLLACRAAGGDARLALPAAAAVELVVNFCEIHADVQAGAPVRGVRETVWWKWGPAQAINAGDGMHALARLTLFGLQDAGLSAEDTFPRGAGAGRGEPSHLRGAISRPPGAGAHRPGAGGVPRNDAAQVRFARRLRRAAGRARGRPRTHRWRTRWRLAAKAWASRGNFARTSGSSGTCRPAGRSRTRKLPTR